MSGNIAGTQGHLTLTSGTSVMRTSVAGATRVFFTPAGGGSFAEVFQDTTDTTKSPAAVVANRNYDLFFWDDAGTQRCTRGPAWNSGAVAGSDTIRGAGAGSTELSWIAGLPFNKFSIAKGPAARQGLFVGTIRSNAASTIDFIYGGLALTGLAAVFNVWNAWNQEHIRTFFGINDAFWTQTTPSFRAAGNSATNFCSFVRGLDTGDVDAEYHALGTPAVGNACQVGIGLDNTTAFSGSTGFCNNTANISQIIARYGGQPGLGAHVITPIERVNTATGMTWYGTAGGPTTIQTGTHAGLWL